jgi:uncharacterized protein YgbK (DUF1537 family)
VVVTGGETLLLALDVLEARSVIAQGEITPGIARGCIVGGPWDGLTFASKSGAFGSRSTWVDLLAARRIRAMS